MLSFLRSALVAALLLLFLQLIVFGDDAKAPAIRPELAAADQLYRAGKFAEAEASYQALLKTDSKLVAAQVGLVDFGILKWSTSAVCFGPPWAQQTSTLYLSVSLGLEGGVGLESQGGAIRADSVGI